ncbi:hypothetical protein EPUS_09006 [Endocarpon pusillum Z07020]|uniref:Pyruvate carboxyltransferase domain-containing protein n=1 Tax=Endocarpon pusillum (strain Z07020 / HMAS-L-300199) TaxID=1263415 RepID=U1I000_ENDPU|nr:uncharacterized protein EPUS_09006 [Endocarpon pusillum Z07020]ERF76525.1 hypothetical protein EPUS_09006 [Endocarpon pusillum Z07020]
MGKLKSKDRQARSSSRPVPRTSKASEASQQQEQQQQRPPSSRPRLQGPIVYPHQLRAQFATGSSDPDASISLANMLAYTYSDEAMQADMRAASPLLRHAIAYRSASEQERRRMKESLPDVVEQEKRRTSPMLQQVAFHRPYVAAKCPTGGVKVPGHGDGTVREDEDHDEGAVTEASSLCSSCNFSNFRIIDSTLREGEQFATAFFDTAQKIKIAKALDDFGVEYIELTSPAASEQQVEFTFYGPLGNEGLDFDPHPVPHGRRKDSRSTGVDGINVAIGTSSHLMKHSHNKDLAYISIKANKVIEYVKAHNLEIRFSGEDSFRSDFAEILKLYSSVDRLGANRVGIADTVGSATPREVFDKIDCAKSWAVTSRLISTMTQGVLSRTPTALSNLEPRTSTLQC